MTVAKKEKISATFDAKRAGRAVAFIERYCKHLHGELAGSPFILEEWQKRDIIYPAFGLINPDGHRQKRFVYVELPKGNGKSYLLSAIALYMAIADGEHNAEVYCVAGDREQARIIFDTCREMVAADATLSAGCKVFKSSIVHTKSTSTIKVISAEAYSKHGYRPYAIMFDELHVQPNRELYDTLTRGMIKRWDSMCWMITTAGVKNTFAEQIHDEADLIRRGKNKNDAWLPVIYNATQEDDPFSPKTWQKANPGMGNIIDPGNFAMLANEAKSNPGALNAFKRLHLNIWTGSVESWIPGHVWDKNTGDIPEAELKNAQLFMGLDIASTQDLSALAYLWRTQDGKLYLKVDTFCPEETIHDRDRKENANYLSWTNDGWVLPTPGNTQDLESIKARILQAAGNWQLQLLAYDPWTADNFAAEIYTRYSVPVRKCQQSLSNLSEPSKNFEQLVISGILTHDGNPVLAWNLDNTQIFRDTNDNYRPHKGKSKGKIDGIMAAINAVWAMLEHDKENPNYDIGNIISFI
jgi:phage terminase large subunit-like protein